MIKWVDVCVKHQLTIYVLAIALCLLGIFCLFIAPIAPFPSPKFNEIDVQLSYPGAGAETVQAQVTAKVVAALKATNGIQHIQASSRAGQANLQLTLDSDTQTRLLKTQIAIMQAVASSHLPQSVPMPQVTVSSGESGLISFVISSNRWSLFRINNFIHATLYPSFKSLPGVSVFASNQNPEVKIQLNPTQLAQYHMSAVAVANALNATNESQPVGHLYLQEQPYMLSIHNTVKTLQQLRQVVVGYRGGPIYLQDIATVSFAPASVVPMVYDAFEGRVADPVNLYTRSQANPFLVSKAALAYIHKVEKSLPPSVHIRPTFNTAKTMHRAINEVIWTIGIASLLVLLIALIFLGHLRTTLIPIVTIPICLLGSVVLVNAVGYSVNLLTLLAFVIAVGLVVDDAIVVVENVSRYLEQGMKRYEAVVHGTHDIALTIIGITLTLLAVYLPIVFCHGPFVFFLKAFVVPLSGAVFISGIVALTLSPLLSLILLHDELTPYQKRFNAMLAVVIHYYQRAFKVMLAMPKRALLVIVVIIAVLGVMGLKLPQRFFPVDPDGTVIITIQGTHQVDIAELKAKAAVFDRFFHSPQVNYYAVEVQPNPKTGRVNANIFIVYKRQYLHHVLSHAAKMRQFIKAQHIRNTMVQVENYSNSGDGADLSVVVYGAKVNVLAKKLTTIMQGSPLFNHVSNNASAPSKQVSFVMDTVKAARVGITQAAMSQALSVYYGGDTLDNNFSIAGLSVPVVVQLNNADLKTERSLQLVTIKSPKNGQVYRLSDFVHTKTVAKSEQITTLDGRPSVEISANLAKGQSLAAAIHYTNALILREAPTLGHVYTGNAKQFLKGNSQTIWIVVLGIMSIYFLLVILFRSLLDPLVILLTVPFTIVGGALSLYLVGGSVNLYSVLGFITLVGLITKHGVLIVQFANQEIKRGANVTVAILSATQHRFRPIIMTTLAMSLGVLPLIFSGGFMFEARRDLGVVIIGGLLIGTLFSLFIVPLVYSLLARKSFP